MIIIQPSYRVLYSPPVPGSVFITASSTFTVGVDCPSNVTLLTFWVRGAGGYGGGVNITSGSGGGGGGFVQGTIPTSSGQVFNLTIGTQGLVTKVVRSGVDLIICNTGGDGSPNGGVAIGGTYVVDPAVTIIQAANGANSGPGYSGGTAPGHPGGEGGGGGGGSYNGVGGAGGSGGVFGRGGQGGYGNAGGGAGGATGINSPGYTGANGGSGNIGGTGATGLMKVEW